MGKTKTKKNVRLTFGERTRLCVCVVDVSKKNIFRANFVSLSLLFQSENMWGCVSVCLSLCVCVCVSLSLFVCVRVCMFEEHDGK